MAPAAVEYLAASMRLIILAGVASVAGRFTARYKVPPITAYIAMGLFSGPYVLDMLDSGSIHRLKWVSDFALSFIAFAAGAELFFPELRRLMRLIGIQVACIWAFSMTVISGVMYAISDNVPFMRDLEGGCRLVISGMFASIMITLSPSSTIALLADSRAKGDMSTALVGITVVADFVAMSSFSVLVTITSMECIGSGFDGIGVGVLFGVIAAALLCGLLMGGLLLFFLWVPRIPSQLRAVFIFAAGFGFAMFSNWLSEHSVTHWQRTVDVQPVLVCVIGSCVAGNESHNRRKFANILHRSAPYVFVPFFVYTGATLKMYALKSSAVTAIVLYFLRLFVLFAGSYVGGRFVDKTLTPAQYSNMWMAMTPSAGTALGLATQVQTLFSGWGTDFNLAVVSLVIINQVTGPALFKIAIRKMGESGKAAINPKRGDLRQVAVLGSTFVSVAIARRLALHRCRTTVVCHRKRYLLHESNEQAAPVSASASPSALGVSTPTGSRALDSAEAVRTQMRLILEAQEMAMKDRFASPNRYFNVADYALPDADETLHHDPELAAALSALKEEPTHSPKLPYLTDKSPLLQSILGDAESSPAYPDPTANELFCIKALDFLVSPQTDAVVFALPFDHENYRWCELLAMSRSNERFFYRKYPTCPRMVVLVQDATMAPKFMDLGALVVYSPSAVAEVVVQLAITHSSMPVELMPASALNVEDVGSMILPEERGSRCRIKISASGVAKDEALNISALAEAAAASSDEEPPRELPRSVTQMSALAKMGLADEAPHVVEAEPAEEQHHISGVSPAVGGRATDRKGNGDDDDDEDGSGGVGVGRDVEVAPSPENAAPAVAVAAALARSPKLPHRRGQSSMMGYPLWSAQRNTASSESLPIDSLQMQPLDPSRRVESVRAPALGFFSPQPARRAASRPQLLARSSGSEEEKD